MYLGAFLTAFALMFLEILATRILGIVQGPETVVYMVAIAMLGMGAAGSLLSILPASGSEERTRRRAALFCVLAGVGALLLFGVSTMIKDGMSGGLDDALRSGGLSGLLTKLKEGRLLGVALLGVILAVPYFFFGVALGLAFRGIASARRARLYASDLAGAALGCFLALGALEFTGFIAPLCVALSAPFLAAAAFLRGLGGRGALVGVVLGVAAFAAPWVPAVSERLEPAPHLLIQARFDDDSIESAEELWHTWDSYARVGAMRRVAKDGSVDWRMTLGEGEGHALVRPYRGGSADPDPPFLPGELALASGLPKKLLVFFAGAGQDLVAIDELARGKVELRGVELNKHMMGWPLTRPEFRLKEFVELPHVHYEVAEAREFLERDQERYDSILLSWSGASLAYYSGAAGFGPRYVYTKEGLAALVDHLAPGGQLTILNTNKVRTLATLRRVLEERGKDIAKGVVILGKDSSAYDWRGAWDQNRVILAPDGITKEALERVAGVARRHGLNVIYAPDAHGEGIDEHPFTRVLREKDLDAVLGGLRRDARLDFSPRSDDRPFVLDVFPPSAYLSAGFWKRDYPKELPDGARTGVRPQWDQRRHHALALLLFAGASLLLILGPPLVARRRFFDRSTRRHHLLLFGALGTGFMLVEVGLVQMLALFVGHPGRALALVLGALILWSGVGSFASGFLFRKRVLGFRSAAILCVLANLALLYVVEEWKQDILAGDLLVKAAVVFGLLALPGFFMGQLFPQALSRIPDEESGPLPWALAVNGLAGTLAASGAILLGQLVGFQGVILCGLACYLLIAFMRHDKGS